MKFSLHVALFFVTFLFFLGCAKTNAFSRFHFDTQKEHAASSLRSSKINFENEIVGVVSTIYLNEVNPKQYNGMEYFLITLYTKNSDQVDDPNMQTRGKILLKLNETSPIKIKKLEQNNGFERFMALDNNWSSYYLVAFERSSTDHLSLTLQDGKFGSLPLVYQKNQQ